MYILLTGCPPFDGKNDKAIIDSVKVGKYPQTTSEFKRLSADAKDLIKKLLTYKPADWISAKDALNHAWISKNKIVEDST